MLSGVSLFGVLHYCIARMCLAWHRAWSLRGARCHVIVSAITDCSLVYAGGVSVDGNRDSALCSRRNAQRAATLPRDR